MSTRSAIGAETECGIRLVYVHSDGYPGGKIDTLKRLVAEHGVSKVVGTLLETTSGWSSFDGNPEELRGSQSDGRFEIVPGFGVRYTLTKINGVLGKDYVQGNADYYTPESPPHWDVEYIYVISADGKTLRWAEPGVIPAGSDTHDWKSLNWKEVPLTTQ